MMKIEQYNFVPISDLKPGDCFSRGNDNFGMVVTREYIDDRILSAKYVPVVWFNGHLYPDKCLGGLALDTSVQRVNLSVRKEA